MATNPASYPRPTPNATVRTLRPAQPAQPARPARDYERAMLYAAQGAGVLALLVFAGPAGFLTPEVGFLVPGFAGIALLAWRARPWTFAAAGILVSLMPLFVLLGFGAVKDLGNPLLGASWASPMLLVLVLVLCAPAAIAGYRRAKAGATPAQPAWRVGLTVLASTFILGATLAGALAAQQATQEGGAAGYDFVPPATAHVAMQGFKFQPGELTLQAGQVTELVVENKDAAFHTFTYSVGGRTYNHDVSGGATARFLVLLDVPGEVQYWCEPHSGGAPGSKTGMVGKLVVA